MNHFEHHDEATCLEMLRDINAYVDGELAADVCRALQQHLAECPDCRVVFDTLTKTLTLYHALDEQPGDLPAGVEARLFRCLTLGE